MRRIPALGSAEDKNPTLNFGITLQFRQHVKIYMNLNIKISLK